jgi:hypothetical protein
MKQALTILVLILAAAGTNGQETAQANDCKPISDPAEYNRKGELKLGRGVDLRLEFGCGKSQILGSITTVVAEKAWPELQGWIVEQVEKEHSLGKKLRSHVYDSGQIALNGRFYRVDEYELGYMQYATTSVPMESGEEPQVIGFIIFYPHEVSGRIELLERRHGAFNDPIAVGLVHEEQEVSLVGTREGMYIVSETEAHKLKKDEKATFVAFGPLDFWVI